MTIGTKILREKARTWAVAPVLVAMLLASCSTDDKKDKGGSSGEAAGPTVIDHTQGQNPGDQEGSGADAAARFSINAVPLKLRTYIELYKAVTALTGVPESNAQFRQYFDQRVSGSLVSTNDPNQFSGTYYLAGIKLISEAMDIVWREADQDRKEALWGVRDPGATPALSLLSDDGIEGIARAAIARANSVKVDEIAEDDARVVTIVKAVKGVVAEMAGRQQPAPENEIKRAALVTAGTIAFANAKIWFY